MSAYFVLSDDHIVGLVKHSHFLIVLLHLFQTLVLFGGNRGWCEDRLALAEKRPTFELKLERTAIPFARLRREPVINSFGAVFVVFVPCVPSFFHVEA